MKKARRGHTGAVDLVVFDLDGTLVDSRQDIARAINHGILSAGGQELPLQDIVPHIGRPLVDTFEALLPVELKPTAQGAAETFRQYYFQHCAETSRLYPGVLACLENLQGVSRAVATTKMTFMAVKVVEEMGIAHHFDLVQGSDGIPHKPHPAVLSRVLEKLKKQPHESWFVGDTVYDIQAGKAAGMRTCAVTYGIGLVDELEQALPDLLLGSLVDLATRIRSG
jgi:2-phosphoglycolate phosphatase